MVFHNSYTITFTFLLQRLMLGQVRRDEVKGHDIKMLKKMNSKDIKRQDHIWGQWSLSLLYWLAVD